MALRLPPPAATPLLQLTRKLAFDPAAPVARQRRMLELVAHLVSFRLRPGTRVTTRQIATVPCEEVRAEGASTDRVVLHLHGGGYTLGSPRLVRAWAAALSAESGATVVVPDYRRAPEDPAPAALRDARRVWDELTRTRPASSVVVGGDSAGGGLALALVQSVVADGGPGPAGLILLSPWLDLTVDRREPAELVARDHVLDPGWLASAALDYAADRHLADPTVSPLLGSLEGLPPVLVLAGTDEVLGPDSDRLVARLRREGGTVTYTRAPGLWHDYPLFIGVIAAADKAAVQAGRFVAGG